jgi:hypothetical protein
VVHNSKLELTHSPWQSITRSRPDHVSLFYSWYNLLRDRPCLFCSWFHPLTDHPILFCGWSYNLQLDCWTPALFSGAGLVISEILRWINPHAFIYKRKGAIANLLLRGVNLLLWICVCSALWPYCCIVSGLPLVSW